jgi:hypothetical protein
MATSDRVRRKEQAMGSRYAAAADPLRDYEKVVTKGGKGVQDAWEQLRAGAGEHHDYWSNRIQMSGDKPTRAEFGIALAGESGDIAGGAYQGKLDPGTVTRTETGTFETGETPVVGGYHERIAPLKTVTDDEVEVVDEDVTDEDNNWSNPQGTVYDASTTTMEMATLTDEMDLSNKLTEIINTNSPLFKAATTRAMQAMAKRGIVNSSIAQGEVMNAILNVAMPIAQAEIKTLTDNLYFNTDWSNKDKAMANEYAYNNMLKKLQGAIDYQLKLLTESGLYQRQRMGDIAGLMGKTYGKEELPQASIWEAYGKKFA